MPASPLEQFQIAFPTQSTNKGVIRRLLDQTLRPPERQYLALVEQIAALEDTGLTYPRIAEDLGLPLPKLKNMVATERYRCFRKYVADRALLQSEPQADDRRRQERRRWDANGGKALDFIDFAFRRHTTDDVGTATRPPRWKKGDYVDPDRAERATKLFAESAGWTTPVTTSAKPKELKVGVIQQAMQAIGAADRRETVVRITTTETIEVGARETSAMGGEG